MNSRVSLLVIQSQDQGVLRVEHAILVVEEILESVKLLSRC